MKKNIFTSTDPKDIAWRAEQMRISNFIEGVTLDQDCEAFLMQLDRDGINDINERLRKIGEFIKAKEKGVE